VIVPPTNLLIDWPRLNPARVIKEKMLRESKLLKNSIDNAGDDNHERPLTDDAEG
jgi:hypothetical protein